MCIILRNKDICIFEKDELTTYLLKVPNFQEANFEEAPRESAKLS